MVSPIAEDRWRRATEAETPIAEDRWRRATEAERREQLLRQGRKREGGRWVEELSATSDQLVPCFIMQDMPFIVLYQRTRNESKMWMKNGQAERDTSGGTGHFEAVVKRMRSATGEDEYTGVFQPGGETAVEYEQVLALATRLMAVMYSQAASERMAVDYDAKTKVHAYQLLDAVGLRVPGNNARKGATPSCVPGVVVAIYKQNNGSGSKKVVRQLYSVWCEYGVLSQKLKIDKLVSISINNFPALLAFREETLTAEERLPESDSNWRSPLDGTFSSTRVSPLLRRGRRSWRPSHSGQWIKVDRER